MKLIWKLALFALSLKKRQQSRAEPCFGNDIEKDTIRKIISI
jgi:hypothetical protein